MLAFYLQMIDDADDKSRFEQLYLEYKSAMFYVADSILHDEFLAEDAVHEAFLRIAKNMKKIGEIKCPQTKSFAVIIVRNISIDLYNKRKKEALTSIDDYAGILPGDERVDDDFFRRQDYNELVRAIGQLPQKYKDAVYLCEVCGYSQKEAARLTGIGSEAMKKRIQRAKQMIKERLGGEVCEESGQHS